jgi:signal transduction histidine kinase
MRTQLKPQQHPSINKGKTEVYIGLSYVSLIILFFLSSLFGLYAVDKGERNAGQAVAAELKTLAEIRHLAAADALAAIAFRTFLITRDPESNAQRYEQDQIFFGGIQNLKKTKLHPDVEQTLDQVAHVKRLSIEKSNENVANKLKLENLIPFRRSIQKEMELLIDKQLNYVNQANRDFFENKDRTKDRVFLLVISISLSCLLGWRFYLLLKNMFFKLEHREAELKQAVRARDEMAGIISHELKNPITAIHLSITSSKRVFHDLLSEKPDLVKIIDAIDSSVLRMERIVSDSLDISQIEAGRLKIEPRLVKVSQLVKEVMDAYQTPACDKGLVLEPEIQPDCPDVFSDPYRIIQVLSNLVGNAIKFTKTGKVIIQVEAMDDRVLFRVRDSGPGIPESQITHVFDRFWQGKETDRRGVGLGLAIAKNIVEAQGGEIWVESQIGRGSSFFFTLPSAKENERVA